MVYNVYLHFFDENRLWGEVVLGGMGSYGIVRRIRCGTEYSRVVQSGMEWYGVVRVATKWYGVVRSGTRWYDVIGGGAEWYGMVWVRTG